VCSVAISYCTIEDVLFNHARIPDRPHERTAITMFIEISEGKINDRLRGKYSVPFSTPVPATIRGICMDLATYYELRRLAGANTGISQEWIDQYKTAAEDAISEVAECKISFDTDEVTRQTLVSSNTRGKQKIFDLGDRYNQDYHLTDDDERYGEQ
jgi:phage gp36-like protein